MHVFNPSKLCLALMLGAATACTADREPEPVRQAQTTPAATQLPPEVLAQLQEEYRVPRGEPAPEPQPNGDADPTVIPQRVREALP